MAAKCASPAPPLGEKHIFENQTVKLGTKHALMNETTVSFVLRSGEMAVWTDVLESMPNIIP